MLSPQLTAKFPTSPSGRLIVAALLALALQGCASAPAKQKPDPATEQTPAAISGRAIAAGDADYARGNYDEALVEYVKAASAIPNNVLALSRIARTQENLGELGMAADAYQRVLAVQPNDAAANEGLGLIMLRRGQLDAAGKLLNIAIKLNPRAWRAYNGLGVIADLSGDYAGAAARYGLANALNPNQPQVLNNLGYSRYMAGDYYNAQLYFRRVLSATPDNEKAWSNLALVYTRQNQYPQAVAAFSEIMSAAEANYSTGYICMLEHRNEDAERLFKQAIALSPSYYEAAYRGLARVQRDSAARDPSATP